MVPTIMISSQSGMTDFWEVACMWVSIKKRGTGVSPGGGQPVGAAITRQVVVPCA